MSTLIIVSQCLLGLCAGWFAKTWRSRGGSMLVWWGSYLVVSVALVMIGIAIRARP